LSRHKNESRDIIIMRGARTRWSDVRRYGWRHLL